MKITVIGGGAAGMMAALTAAEDSNNRVTLLERQSRVGRKLLATGNGRCNLTNLNVHPKHYHGLNPEFINHALNAFSVEDTLAYFRSLGLLTVTEESGRVYPMSNQANSVVDVLRFALNRKNIDVRCSCEVQSIGKKARGYYIQTAEEKLYADKVIIACGGTAGSKLGGTDLGYKLLQSLGHTMTRVSPSLVQMRSDGATKSLKGVRAEASLTLKRSGQTTAVGKGEVQFTDFGISGPAVFDLSREASYGGDQVLLLDFLQDLSEDEVFTFLLQKKNAAPELPLEDFLTGILHNRLGRVILSSLDFKLDRLTENLSENELSKIAKRMKYFPVQITGVLGMDQAQVTAGGIRTDEFRPDTLESRIAPGIYAAGEVLDIDGDCGGYNLQWAWSSGRLAGQLSRTGEKT